MSTEPKCCESPWPHGLGRQPSLSTKKAPGQGKAQAGTDPRHFTNRGEVKVIINQGKSYHIDI